MKEKKIDFNVFKYFCFSTVVFFMMMVVGTVVVDAASCTYSYERKVENTSTNTGASVVEDYSMQLFSFRLVTEEYTSDAVLTLDQDSIVAVSEDYTIQANGEHIKIRTNTFDKNKISMNRERPQEVKLIAGQCPKITLHNGRSDGHFYIYQNLEQCKGEHPFLGCNNIVVDLTGEFVAGDGEKRLCTDAEMNVHNEENTNQYNAYEEMYNKYLGCLQDPKNCNLLPSELKDGIINGNEEMTLLKDELLLWAKSGKDRYISDDPESESYSSLMEEYMSKMDCKPSVPVSYGTTFIRLVTGYSEDEFSSISISENFVWPEGSHYSNLDKAGQYVIEHPEEFFEIDNVSDEQQKEAAEEYSDGLVDYGKTAAQQFKEIMNRFNELTDLSQKAPGPDFGDCSIIGDVKHIVQIVFDWVKYLAPALLILFSSLDFGKAVISDDDSAMKKATSNFIKRAIATAAIFFLPLIINVLLHLDGIESGLEDALCGISKVVIK